MRRLNGSLGLALWLVISAMGCAPEQTLPTPRVAGLVGQPIESSIAMWGPDYRQTPEEGGQTAYTWRYEGVRVVRTGRSVPSGIPVQPGASGQPELTVESCELRLLTDAHDVVVSYRAQGDACIYALSEPRLWGKR